MKIFALAKINLGLEVIRRRDDGYHELRTLFQSLSLADELEFFPRNDDLIRLSGNKKSVSWGNDNLIYQAALALKRAKPGTYGVEIKVRKNIPPGYGLGGGSSNAAVTLLFLNQLWKLGLAPGELVEIGRQLGADVPFFFHGGFCLGEGRGDLIQPQPEKWKWAVLVVLPPFSLSTRWVFQQARLSLTSKPKVSKINQFLKSGCLAALENELEEVVFSRFPRLREIKEALKDQKAELSLMSGSGSALYGLFATSQQAEEAGREISRLFPEVEFRVCQTVKRSQYWTTIGVGV